MAKFTRDSEIELVKQRRTRNKKYTANLLDDDRKQGKKQSDYRRHHHYQTLYEYFNPE